MLNKTQEIIYKRNGNIFSKLTSENIDDLNLKIMMYIRNYQPFVKPNDRLGIPTMNGKVLNTSKITSIDRKKNEMICKTRNSVYEIEYKNINLERILEDGPGEGVNKETPTNIIPYFPDLSKK